MRSFAVVALIGAAVAMPQYEAAEPSTSVYQAYPVETPSAPAYEASTPAYEASSSAPAYEASSSAPAYEASSSAPAYHVESTSSAGYAASTPVYPTEAYPVTSTKVVEQTTFVCPTPTVVTYEDKTYSVTEATTLTISSYSTVVVKTTHTPEAEKPSSKPEAPVYSATVPAPVAPTHAPYPSNNATVPHIPQGTATGYPTSTKPATPEFTGAAAQAGVGLLAVVGALAAFL